MHAYIHARIYADMRTAIHTSIHPYIHTYIHAYILTYMHVVQMYMWLHRSESGRYVCSQVCTSIQVCMGLHVYIRYTYMYLYV